MVKNVWVPVVLLAVLLYLAGSFFLALWTAFHKPRPIKRWLFVILSLQLVICAPLILLFDESFGSKVNMRLRQELPSFLWSLLVIGCGGGAAANLFFTIMLFFETVGRMRHNRSSTGAKPKSHGVDGHDVIPRQ